MFSLEIKSITVDSLIESFDKENKIKFIFTNECYYVIDIIDSTIIISRIIDDVEKIDLEIYSEFINTPNENKLFLEEKNIISNDNSLIAYNHELDCYLFRTKFDKYIFKRNTYDSFFRYTRPIHSSIGYSYGLSIGNYKKVNDELSNENVNELINLHLVDNMFD